MFTDLSKTRDSFTKSDVADCFVFIRNVSIATIFLLFFHFPAPDTQFDAEYLCGCEDR